MGRQLNKYYRSFSGTDALVFAILPNSSPVVLGTLSTVSYSMYRDKKPVPVIGQINVGGFTRGTRIYAGTMIFTMINQHWLNELTADLPWIKYSGVDKVDELPLFDLMIVCANEYGATMQMMIYGVDLTEEGQVLSVENLFTENTFSFVARDVVNFTNELTEKNNSITSSTWTPGVKRGRIGYTLPSSRSAELDLTQNHTFMSSRMVESEEVKSIQERLNIVGQTEHRSLYPLEITGRYDEPTCDAVLRFQSRAGLPMTGEMDDETYLTLKRVTDSSEALKELDVLSVAKITSEHGATVKSAPSHLARSIYRYNFNEEVVVLAITPDGNWIQTEKGYIPAHQTLHHQQGNRYVFKVIDASCQDSALIGEIQNEIRTNGNVKAIKTTGIYDAKTQYFIHQFQEEQGLPVTRVLDEATWYALKSHGYLTLADEYVYEEKQRVALKKTPTSHTASLEELKASISDYGMTYHSLNERSMAKLSLTVQYANGTKETAYLDKVIEPNQETMLSLLDFEELVEAAGEKPVQPNRMEFTAYILHDVPYKWTINLEEAN